LPYLGFLELVASNRPLQDDSAKTDATIEFASIDLGGVGYFSAIYFCYFAGLIFEAAGEDDRS
jgi:hypothetical protein